MGLPLPAEFDGRILDEIFEEQVSSEQTPAAASSSAEGSLARRKLKKLLEA